MKQKHHLSDDLHFLRTLSYFFILKSSVIPTANSIRIVYIYSNFRTFGNSLIVVVTKVLKLNKKIDTAGQNRRERSNNEIRTNSLRWNESVL